MFFYFVYEKSQLFKLYTVFALNETVKL